MIEEVSSEEGVDLSRPKEIGVSFSYFSIAMPFDEAIVRRIREDHDPFFVPIVKFEEFQWATGRRERFVHFGFGFAFDPNLPILDNDVYSAPKPSSGYLSTLPRASGVAVWAQGPPFAPKVTDGTPGVTVPFEERAYAHARDCKEETYRRAERAIARFGQGDNDENSIPGVRDEVRQAAYKAVLAHHGDNKAKKEAAKASEFDKLCYVLKQEKQTQKSFVDLSDSERRQMADLYARGGDTKNAVHFALPASPAKPGGLILTPY